MSKRRKIELYKPLGGDLKVCGKDDVSEKTSTRKLESFVKNVIIDERKEVIFSSKIKDRSLRLEPADKLKKKTVYSGDFGSANLNRIEKNPVKKFRGLFVVEKKEEVYSLYIPLHFLWKQYIGDILKGIPLNNDSSIATKMVKADFHGAILKVTRAKCASLIGIEGIVLQETENTFKIITKDNRIKVVPKSGCYFEIKLGDLPKTVVIYGTHFCFRPHERSSRKFKPKPTIEL